MTKKHFEAFAREIMAHWQGATSSKQIERAHAMADMVIKVASADNPQFDKGRFLKACGLES